MTQLLITFSANFGLTNSERAVEHAANIRLKDILKRRALFGNLIVVVILATISSCKNTTSENENGLTSTATTQVATVIDMDGNVYETVQIGTQLWMKQNLKVAHYRDGSAIEEIEDNATWENTEYTHTPAWCYYGGNAENNATYGKLYNWYAVANPRNICPPGWHVPTDADFQLLSNYLGGDKVAGGKMKAVTLWDAPNNSADNSSGFTALPAGLRKGNAGFVTLGIGGYFWSASHHSNDVRSRDLSDYHSDCYSDGGTKTNGCSVRCVKD